MYYMHNEPYEINDNIYKYYFNECSLILSSPKLFVR